MTKPLSKDFVANKHLGLSVEKPVIPDAIRKAAAENGLFEKTEFHISILVARSARVAWRVIRESDRAEKFRVDIETLFKSYAWEYALTDEYFLHEHVYTLNELLENGEDGSEHTRRSIVQKVSLPDLSSFYLKVNEILGTRLPVPIPHITLFAWSDYEPYKRRGLGVNSAEQFKQFTKERLVA